jgi:serine/threonine-protein kinase
MNSEHPPRNDTLTPAEFVEINRIRDRLVADWRAGGRPSIEDHLAPVREPFWSALLKELLDSELECRRSAGERPTSAEYRARFPDHLAIVEAAFSAGDERPQGPAQAAASPAKKPTPAAPGEPDRNLLFGVLALQMDFITRDALVEAMNAWLLQKHRSLAEILEERGALAPADRGLLEPLVRRHIQQHGNDPAQSLAAISSIGSVRADLSRIADPELHASLAQVSAARRDDDPYRTVAEASLGASSAIGARFRVLRPHARGGLGEVFVARDTELNRDVALKEIQDRYADDPRCRARFLLEAEITGGLEHPGIVPVYGLGVAADGRPYYAMRFIKGDSLKDAIARFHKDPSARGDAGARMLELKKLLRRFLDVCNAVAYAHSRGVLHRDLKPGNIMVGQYGETLVVDWGLAKVVGRSDATAPEATLRPPSAGGSSETLPGSAVGTPAFMCPEQAEGRLDLLGPASDVYSLGATLYCLLTGRAPVEEPDAGVVLERVRRGEIPRPRQVQPGLPRPLEAICRKAMA